MWFNLHSKSCSGLLIISDGLEWEWSVVALVLLVETQSICLHTVSHRSWECPLLLLFLKITIKTLWNEWMAALQVSLPGSRSLLELHCLEHPWCFICLSPDLTTTSSCWSSCDWLIQKLFFIPLCHLQLKYSRPLPQPWPCFFLLLTRSMLILFTLAFPIFGTKRLRVEVPHLLSAVDFPTQLSQLLQAFLYNNISSTLVLVKACMDFLCFIFSIKFSVSKRHGAVSEATKAKHDLFKAKCFQALGFNIILTGPMS